MGSVSHQLGLYAGLTQNFHQAAGVLADGDHRVAPTNLVGNVVGEVFQSRQGIRNRLHNVILAFARPTFQADSGNSCRLERL